MPEGVGYYGDEDHDRLVSQIVDREKFFRGQLEAPFRAMLRWWKLYLAQAEDQRDPVTEYWRANVFVPYPYSGVETKLATVTDILSSSDPIVQAEGVDMEDEPYAKTMERLQDQTMRVNRWRYFIDVQLRDTFVQGTSFFKTINKRRSRRVRRHANPEMVKQFAQHLDYAQKRGASKPPNNPDDYDKWRRDESQRLGFTIHPNPFVNTEEVSVYRGPIMERVPIFDLRFDPLCDDIQAQTLFCHRMVWPIEKVQKMADPKNPNAMFDAEQVEAAMGGGDENPLNEFDMEINEMLNIEQNSEADPAMKKACELFECYLPHNDDGPKWLVLMNRKAFINKKPMRMPYGHDEIPMTQLKNVPIGGRSLGISELQQPEKLYHEINTLRNLRLDGVTLSTLPAFVRQREVGMADLQKRLRPGEVFEAARADGIRNLLQGYQVPAEVFREIPDLKLDIDETNSTPANLRGGASQVGRVSATESERRFTQALTRMKQQVARTEEELLGFVHQSIHIWYEFAEPGELVRVAGKNPIMKLDPDELIQALDVDYRFRGASKALNRDMVIQQLQSFAQLFMPQMSPKEMRALQSRIYEAMGQPGAEVITTDETTEILQTNWQKQQELILFQTEQQLNPPPPPPAEGGGEGAAPPAEAAPPAAPPPEGSPLGPAPAPQEEPTQLAPGLPALL